MSNKIYLGLKKVFNNEVSVDSFFEKELSYLDYKHIAALSALAFVEDKINANKLKTYSDIVSRFNLDDFSFAIVCLYEMYQDNDIPFPFQERQDIIWSICQSLVDNGNSDYDEYIRRLRCAISGLYQFDRYLVKDNGRELPLYGVWN
ncbi:hypothetical protein [Salmonella enterica]|uniref:Uncharacterized protein n=2 Tax=Salmonella enterica TaxID=28901 RepID=A0A505CWZ7_SALER|nr:hypothetical protein [Salmonella enterica]ELQ7879834.1 hypothetical protein [Escherichia coli]ANA22288.1 hypothetical protein UQ50_18435 [Salmonella enterica subsp. diarizonae]ANA26513.1 hypothetical protein UQ48_18455 [Salmonella enterica subsp. diarizonae]ANA30858.1 hypothetical protein UQ49_18470 [Salmonella enterica subsp. diarizonae]ATW53419.1 hypothetical protein CNQ75_02055 [Salmonella enterica subsp. diarizonae]